MRFTLSEKGFAQTKEGMKFRSARAPYESYGGRQAGPAIMLAN